MPLSKMLKTIKPSFIKHGEDLPELYITSAEKKEGGDKILDFIQKTNEFLTNNNISFDE